MNHNSDPKKYNFKTAYLRMKSKYGIDMNIDEFIEAAMYEWIRIGSNDIVKHFDKRIKEDGIIVLPDDVEHIISVKYVTPIRQDTRYDSAGLRVDYYINPNEVDAERKVSTDSADYIEGIELPYEIVDNNTIKLRSEPIVDSVVRVKYTTAKRDEDGLPFLTFMEIDAIATNVALQEATKKAFSDPKQYGSLLAFLKEEAGRIEQAAQLPLQLTDGDMQEIIKAKKMM